MTQANPQNVAPDLSTSPVVRIHGQKGRWHYPDKNLTPEDSVYIRNINLSEFGSADSRYGVSLYNTTQIPEAAPPVGIIQEKFTTGVNQFVVTPTKIFHDTGTTRTDLTGALALTGTLNDRVRHAFISDKIVGTNAVNATWVKDNGGSVGVATALSGVPWSTCVDLIAHKGVLVALASTESSVKNYTRLRWCDINTKTFVPDITVWRGDNRFEVYQGGAPIVGGVDNYGKLVIFKEDGAYFGALEYDVGFIEFRMDELVLRGFHPIAKNSFLARPEFIFGIAKEGPFVIRPDMSFELIGRDIQDVWNTQLNLSRLQYAVSWVREKEQQVRTLISSASSTTGFDLVMVWDWVTGQFTFEQPHKAMNYGARAVLSNEEVDLMGSTDGYLFTGNLATDSTDNGSGISWHVRMAPNDLGMPGITKHIVDVTTLFYSRTGEGIITLNVNRDQGQLATRSTNLDLSTSLVWDGGLSWDTGLSWGGAQVRQSRYFVNRTAENISPEWYGSSPVSLIGYQVTFTVQEQ